MKMDIASCIFLSMGLLGIVFTTISLWFGDVVFTGKNTFMFKMFAFGLWLLMTSAVSIGLRTIITMLE